MQVEEGTEEQQMFSVQGLIIMFMFGILMYVLVEGLVEMYREWRAEKDEQFKRA